MCIYGRGYNNFRFFLVRFGLFLYVVFIIRIYYIDVVYFIKFFGFMVYL